MVTGIADKTKQPDEKAQGATPAPEARAAGNEEHTKETPRMYSQEELDARLGKAGGRMKAQLELVTKERDDFRTKHESVTKTHAELNSQITAAKEEIESLKATVDSLNSEDAVKAKQLIRDWERKLSSLNERETNLTPREERVNNFERTELIYTVADEYGLDDPEAKDKFKAAADRLKMNLTKDKTLESLREDLETLAETMGLGQREEEESEEEKEAAKEPAKPKAPARYSGKSEGGTPYFTRAQIANRTFYVAHREEIDKADKEGRIRD